MKFKFLFFLFVPALTFSQTFSLMTYNIRYDNPSDGNNAWSLRKESLVSQIEKYNPAILGIQEGLHHQVLYLDSCLVNYSYVGVGRDDGKTKGEYCAIFYDTTLFSVVETSTFWLSTTPEIVSVGWNASMERICTYAIFEDNRTSNHFLVLNTHFDHIGIKARRNSAKLVISRISDLANENTPVVLMGDFNDIPTSKTIQIISSELLDANSIANEKNSVTSGTFNAFDKNLPIDKKIDFIFVRNLEIISVEHINEMRKDGYFISDHLPVLVCVSY
jgi:endonuclease/exonuclease/phosphatase family metal-dependent hydrolase